jgi:UDP-glucuronate 4-epimerase
MNIVVTGAAGFIGSHLCERLCARGDHVTGFDNFDPFDPREVKERNLRGLRGNSRFRLYEGDLTDPQDIAGMLEVAGAVDAVVHLAALAGVQPSLKAPQRYYAVNVTGTLHLLAECRGRGIGRFVIGSSSSVYGLDSEVPFREGDACGKPLSPYAATKRAAELLAFTEHHLHGADVTCLRFFTVYGPRQRPDLAIHKFTRLIAEDRPVPLFGDGSSSRDYTWIDDILDGVVAAVDRQAGASRPAYRIYNLGGSRPTSLKNLVERISAALGRTAQIDWRPAQPGDMPHTLAEVELARAELGYAPKVSVEEGIPRFVAWFRNEYGR